MKECESKKENNYLKLLYRDRSGRTGKLELEGGKFI